MLVYIIRRLLQMKAAHGQLPVPEAAGRSIAMPASTSLSARVA